LDDEQKGGVGFLEALCYRQREVVVKIAYLQSFENQNERIHQSSNPPKSGYILRNEQKYNLDFCYPKNITFFL